MFWVYYWSDKNGQIEKAGFEREIDAVEFAEKIVDSVKIIEETKREVKFQKK